MDPLRETAVTAMLEARKALQAVKHADEDPVAARDIVETMMQSLHGALGMTLRFAALALSQGDLDATAHAIEPSTEPDVVAGEVQEEAHAVDPGEASHTEETPITPEPS